MLIVRASRLNGLADRVAGGLGERQTFTRPKNLFPPPVEILTRIFGARLTRLLARAWRGGGGVGGEGGVVVVLVMMVVVVVIVVVIVRGGGSKGSGDDSGG